MLRQLINKIILNSYKRAEPEFPVLPFSELCSDSLSSAFGHAYISRLSHLLQNLIKNSLFMRKPKYATSFTIFSCHAILDTTVPLERVIPDARKELISNRKMRVGITRRAYLKIKKGGYIMAHDVTGISAKEALLKLKKGNETYLNAASNPGDISPDIRKDTCENGQFPYAVVVTCSDSRVIPESIFSAGIGELFTIRVAGNVINDFQLGSVEYAADHLGSKLIVVLGHTHCGAVGAAMSGHTGGFIKAITDEIKAAIGDETDEYKACCLNIENSIRRISDNLHIPAEGTENGVKVIGAVYHIDDGHVEFME